MKRSLFKGMSLVAISALVGLAGCSVDADVQSSPDSRSDDADAAVDGAGSDEPLQVVMVSGETGPLAVNSQALRDGLEAAKDTLNEEGGVLSRQIEIEGLDSQSDPTKAVSLLQEYISSNGTPDLVIAGLVSNEALALAPLLSREEVIGFTTASSPQLDDPETYPYLFGSAAKHNYVTSAAVEFLKQQEGVEKVGLVIPNDALKEAVEPSLDNALEEAGIDLEVYAFDPASIDLTSPFTLAKSDNVDWIYADGVGEVVPRIFEGRQKAGAETIPVIGGSGMAVSPFIDFTTEDQRINFFPALYPLTYYVPVEERSDSLNNLISRLPDFDNYPVPLSSAAYGYDQIMIWAEAIEQGGSADPSEIRHALENLESSGKDISEQPWTVWSNLYSEETHFPRPKVDEFVFSEVTGELKDTLFVLK